LISIKHIFWEVREHPFCLKYRYQRMLVCHHYLFWQTPVATTFIGCCRKRFFHCNEVFTCVLCNVQGRSKIISSSKLRINKANAVQGRLISKWFYTMFTN